METRYIKLEYDEAILARKRLLLIELNFLESEKKLRNYKLLRRRELLNKNKLRTFLKAFEIRINLLKSTFPEEERPKIPRARMKRIEKGNNQHIQKQLEEIEEKLAKIRKF
jgi:hypothetical protein